jgi:hypothetical protein
MNIRNEGEAAGGPGGEGGRGDRGTRPIDPSRPCRNCGDPTPGEYCPTCGQRKADVRVSLRTLLMEVLEDQFILDRRLPRTLGALLFLPGHLTAEHVDGRIVRYIHPFRLYLVSSLVFFILLSLFSLELARRAMDQSAAGVEIGAGIEGDAAALDEALAELRLEIADTTNSTASRTALRVTEARVAKQRRRLTLDSLTSAVADLTGALDQIDHQVADSTVPEPVRAALQSNRAVVERELAGASAQRQALLDNTVPGDGVRAEGGVAGAADADTVTADTVTANSVDGPATATTPAGNGADRPLRDVFGWTEGAGPTVLVGLPAVDSALGQQVRRIAGMTAAEAVETLLGTFFNYVPTMMFILLPVFAGVLKLLYIRRRRFYAEHFVFLLHVHSMVYILAVVMLLLRRYVAVWLDLLLVGWILIYIFMAMKRVYGQGWFRTLIKYWILGWAYFWILIVSIPFALIATLLLF